jgi:tRNA pseudouridine55 synthase
VVVRVRRVLQEPRIGHTGTLDPLASGVLPLVVGRATRLARFLSGADKRYQATLRLGVATDSGDSLGTPIGPPYVGPLPNAVSISLALAEFRGRFLQQPPALSAKKIGGQRSYQLARHRARQNERAGAGLETLVASADLPAPVAVTVHAIALTSVERDLVTLEVECSAGFYVRALARDIGERLGTAAHLTALRRTRSGDVTAEDALPLAAIEDTVTGYQQAVGHLVPLNDMLPDMPVVQLTEQGTRRVAAGHDLSPTDFTSAIALPEAIGSRTDWTGWCRLVDGEGQLLALGQRAEGSTLLHPSVVLV